MLKILKFNIEAILDKNKEVNKLVDEFRDDSYRIRKKYNNIINTIRDRNITLDEVVRIGNECSFINTDNYFTPHELDLSNNYDDLKKSMNELLYIITKYNSIIMILKKSKTKYKNTNSLHNLKFPFIKLVFNNEKEPLLLICKVDSINKNIIIDGFLSSNSLYTDLTLRCSLKKCYRCYSNILASDSYSLCITYFDIKKDINKNKGFATITLSYLQSLIPVVTHLFNSTLSKESNHVYVITEISAPLPHSQGKAYNSLYNFYTKNEFIPDSHDVLYKTCPLK